MSRSQDLIGVLKGLQILMRGVVKSQEKYLQHVWANSSIRDVLEQNVKLTEERTKQFINNPSKQLEELGSLVRETIERTAVVVDGVKQYATTNVENTNKSSNSSDIKADLSNLDISSLTLKELEKILSDHKNRESKVKNVVNSRNTQLKANDEEKEHIFGEIGLRNTQPDYTTKDEKYLADWMNFLRTHDTNPKQDVKVAIPTPPVATNSPIPTVSDVPQIPIPSIVLPELSAVAKQRKVPSSRIGRMASFGGLFAGLGIGTINELTKGMLGFGGSTNVKEAVFSQSNAERIVDTLCKVRGAALKLGQILSIQDSNIVSPQLVKAFDRVRQAADYMPDWQVEEMMTAEMGYDWKSKFEKFDDKPFAAASIGQVHRGVTKDGMEVAVKIQYPGIAESIESDIDNLVGLLKVWDVFPPGMFIDNIVHVAKRELIWEVDYQREADYTVKFREMISKHPEYRVPRVVRDLSTKRVLTTELVPGVPLDKCFDMSYEDRHFVGQSIMKLCLQELFAFRCMQTDPNWSNFLYDKQAKQLILIDFGSTRFYTKEFMDNYIQVINAAVNDNPAEVLRLSKLMGFLTGYETKQMEDAHVNAVMILGEIFRRKGEFSFGSQNTTKEIAHLVPTMIAHRLCPPPEEIYSLHRKLSGVFLLCYRLNINLACRPMFEEVVRNYNFDEN